MKSLKRSTVLLFAFLSLFLVVIFAMARFEKEDLKGGISLPGSKLINFHQVDSGVYRSDQPYPDDFKALEQYGIVEVLNLRRYNQDDDKAKDTSLTLHHIPIHAHLLSEADLVEAMRIIRDRKGPILIHCFHGSNRTGAVAALYQMVFCGVPKEEAIREMLEGGYGHHKVYINIPRLLRKIDVEKLRNELGLEKNPV
ncbi:protein tyrosine/serine phosphatase [Parabacteroides sp. PF5-6]|nr:protein tyrosine/serine phosphatase [Parabacteroides sp. PF5-6]